MQKISSGSNKGAAGPGQQAGAGGPVKPGTPSSQTGGEGSRAAAANSAHQSVSAPGPSAGKVGQHLKPGNTGAG